MGDDYYIGWQADRGAAAAGTGLGAFYFGYDKLKGDPPAIHRDHPRFAGAALWAKSLHSRVSRQWELLDAAQTKAIFSNLAQILEVHANLVTVAT